MTFLPIVERELRVASRRRATYWTRAGVAGAIIVIGVAIFLFALEDAPTKVGKSLFYCLTIGTFLHALVLGVRATADCLSEEKREGTLGLLFLTDLKGYDVVLGKLVATSINGFYGLLAAVPVMAIPLLLGGVTHGEFWRMALVLANTLFFSLAVGIFVSSMSQTARKAMAGTFFLILFISAGLPLLGVWAAFATKIKDVVQYFVLPSPGCMLTLAYESPMRTSAANGFWISAGIVHGLAWMFLWLASLITPHAWQDKPAGAGEFRWRDWWQTFCYGNSVERRSFRRRLLDQSAFFWLAARRRLDPAWVWAFLGLIGCLWLWGALKFRRDWFGLGIYFATALVLNSILKGWVASEAARTLAENRRVGALELLLSTPLTVTQILRGQMLALRRQFFLPVVFVLIVETVFLIAMMRDPVLQSDSEFTMTLWISWINIVFIADLITLYWVGMWMGLAARNINRASSAAVIRIMVLPGISWLAISGIVMFINMRAHEDPNWGFFVWLWFGLSFGFDLAFGLWSRRQLYLNFRSIAAQRYMAKTAWWKRPFVSESAGSKMPAVEAAQ
jgi:hypothetical protein